ncbi:hypothetical protein SAMN04487898_12381 [Pedobacter sp. ok626]|uniref:hypothetical protein n=1 Tax=Pedobacter sp. ok626 TaxID=1761882 RepID=UPI00088A5770|nr:hypothetical protein [Pedobacter sp. ok626]SDL72562.1 hypothetical protein SAMN04487898_12381 [Pedobacter sp. ok626]
MNSKEKKELLKSLDERQFRTEVIIPLLSKMGYLAPVEYHGVNEKGKDIICFEYDRLNEQRFLAVVAKTGDLSGSASSTMGLMNVVTQVQQAFDNPYENLFNMRQVFINEVWVMTTGKIVSSAQESVIATLRKTNLDKQIRIIGDDRLIGLIDKHFSTYWNSSNETKESVIIQRDRLIRFIEGLLKHNNADKSTIESVKASILYSNYDPRLHTNFEGLHFSYISSYSIELAKIDPEYDDYITSFSHGITKEKLVEAKNDLAASFYDIMETMEKADKILKITNPQDFVDQADYELTEYPFSSGWGPADDFLKSVEYLREGLDDLKYFKAFLQSENKLEWAKKLSKSIADLLPEIEQIINTSQDEEIFLNYTIDESTETIKIDYGKQNTHFHTKFKRIDPNGFRRNRDGSEKPEAQMKLALKLFRDYLDESLAYDWSEWRDLYDAQQQGE